MSAPDKNIHKQPQARLVRSVDLRTVAGARIQLVGVDMPSVVPVKKVLGVVEIPLPMNTGAGLAELVADAVVKRLQAGGAAMPAADIGAMAAVGAASSVSTLALVPAIGSRSSAPNTGARKPLYVDLTEAAEKLATTKAALKKYLARHQRRDGRETVCALGDGARAVKIRGHWRVRFDAVEKSP